MITKLYEMMITITTKKVELTSRAEWILRKSSCITQKLINQKLIMRNSNYLKRSSFEYVVTLTASTSIVTFWASFTYTVFPLFSPLSVTAATCCLFFSCAYSSFTLVFSYRSLLILCKTSSEGSGQILFWYPSGTNALHFRKSSTCLISATSGETIYHSL